MDVYTTFEIKLAKDMTCLGCKHFDPTAYYSLRSVHPYCKLLGAFITCVIGPPGSGYCGTDQLPIKHPKCINEFLGPIERRRPGSGR